MISCPAAFHFSTVSFAPSLRGAFRNSLSPPAFINRETSSRDQSQTSNSVCACGSTMRNESPFSLIYFSTAAALSILVSVSSISIAIFMIFSFPFLRFLRSAVSSPQFIDCLPNLDRLFEIELGGSDLHERFELFDFVGNILHLNVARFFRLARDG